MSSKNVKSGEKTPSNRPFEVMRGDSAENGSQPLGRRARKALAVRQALFTAGLNAFERQPIALVSVLDITEAADVAKGVFYLYFRSKDQYLLALWEEVQKLFLAEVQDAVAKCKSQSARIESLVDQYIHSGQTSPAVARFWMRMSSYFPDEVGEPGHLKRLQQSFGRRLAALLIAKDEEHITEGERRAALLIDTYCRAALNMPVDENQAPASAASVVPVVAAILKNAP